MNCIWRNIYIESDEFYQLALHILSIIQIPLHIFGAFIIIKKTPKTMGEVKFSMLLLHFTCFWCDINLSIFSRPVVYFPVATGYFLGLFDFFNLPNWFNSYITLTSIFLCGPAIVMFFENRYNRLVREDSESKSRKIKRALHYIFNYGYALTLFVPPLLNIPDIEQMRPIIREKLPCLPLSAIDNPKLFTMAENLNVIVACILLVIVFVTLQTSVFFFGLLNFLFKTKAMSVQTVKLQRTFFKALCIQVAIPTCALALPSAYTNVYAYQGNLDMALENLTLITLASHGLFSTVIMLLVHTPYRQATLEVLGVKNLRVPLFSISLVNSRNSRNYKHGELALNDLDF